MNTSSTSIFKGTILTVATRWIDRLVGLISTIVLARLLTPEDFGVVAIASVVIGFVNVFLDLGVHTALIKIKQIEQDHFNTAWTIRILQTSTVAFFILIASPIIADFFNDDRSKLVLYFLAFLPLLNALENIGLIDYYKKMQFQLEFRFLAVKRIISFIIVVTLAFVLRSYWALVVGQLAAAFVGMLLSYYIQPMRPVFSLVKFRELFSISQWMLLNNVGVYLTNNLPKVFIGRWSATEIFGSYTLAEKIARMPSTELLAPFNRVLFPAFSKVQDNVDELKKVFLLAQGVQILISVPAAVGLSLVANEVVLLFLGVDWVGAIPFIQVLALMSILGALTGTSYYLMIVLGYIRLNVMIIFLRVLVFSIVMTTFFLETDAIIVAWVNLLVGVFGILLSFFVVTYVFPAIKLMDFVRNSIRPVVGVLSMTTFVICVDTYLNFPLIVNLFVKVLFCILIYAFVVILLWFLCKKPCGAESYIINKISLIIGFSHKNN